jgi:hypothetical protein
MHHLIGTIRDKSDKSGHFAEGMATEAGNLYNSTQGGVGKDSTIGNPFPGEIVIILEERDGDYGKFPFGRVLTCVRRLHMMACLTSFFARGRGYGSAGGAGHLFPAATANRRAVPTRAPQTSRLHCAGQNGSLGV